MSLVKANRAPSGDYMDIVCDGTSFFVVGQTKLDGGIALA